MNSARLITASAALIILLLFELEHRGIILPQPLQTELVTDHTRNLWLITCLAITACVAPYFARQNQILATTLRDEARVDSLPASPTAAV